MAGTAGVGEEQLGGQNSLGARQAAVPLLLAQRPLEGDAPHQVHAKEGLPTQAPQEEPVEEHGSAAAAAAESAASASRRMPDQPIESTVTTTDSRSTQKPPRMCGDP